MELAIETLEDGDEEALLAEALTTKGLLYYHSRYSEAKENSRGRAELQSVVAIVKEQEALQLWERCVRPWTMTEGAGDEA